MKGNKAVKLFMCNIGLKTSFVIFYLFIIILP